MALPADPFETIALDLHQAAVRQAMANESMEFFVLKSNTPEMTAVLAASLREAANLGRLYELFRNLAPYEAEFRKLLEEFISDQGAPA